MISRPDEREEEHNIYQQGLKDKLAIAERMPKERIDEGAKHLLIGMIKANIKNNDYLYHAEAVLSHRDSRIKELEKQLEGVKA